MGWLLALIGTEEISNKALSVVDRVLTEFVDAVAAEEGYADVAERLREAILEKHDMSETALQGAMFGVDLL